MLLPMGSTNFIVGMSRNPNFTTMFTLPDEQLESVPTPESFTRVIDVLVRRYQLSYFDAILELCEHYEREYESVKPLLTPKLKLALTEEVAQRRLLKDKTFLLDKLG